MSNSPSRITALAIGGLLLVVGALGFTADEKNWLFGVLSVNATQNLLHLAVGAVLVAVAFSTRAPLLAAIIGTLMLALGIAGLYIIGTPANVIGVNGAANLLHLAGAAVLLAVGLGARR
jgi:hypothetical protein